MTRERQNPNIYPWKDIIILSLEIAAYFCCKSSDKESLYFFTTNLFEDNLEISVFCL